MRERDTFEQYFAYNRLTHRGIEFKETLLNLFVRRRIIV